MARPPQPKKPAPNARRRRLKRVALWMLGFFVLGNIILLLLHNWVSSSSEGSIYRNLEDVPPREAALLLGTAPYMSSGRENLFFSYRIQAAAALFEQGRIERILISGDNEHDSYNEPRAMYRALVDAGVPDSAIVWDYAGFRTLDSVVRAQYEFGEEDFIIVSQKFHLERALFIARGRGIRAIGYTAKTPANRGSRFRMWAREVAARALTFADLYVLNTQPRFLNEANEPAAESDSTSTD